LIKGGKPMIVNKLVVHDKEGNVLKGTTADFLPKKPMFHLSIGGINGEEIQKIVIDNLKAVFFVKDFEGDKNHHEATGLDNLPAGKKIRAQFKDGEAVSGYTHVLNMGQPGFFLIPADPQSNNERIFIVFSSLSQLEVDGSVVPSIR
jgi:hypothetical protein